MIQLTNYTITKEKLQEAIDQLPCIDFKLAINEPTGNFFYDPWKIKNEFQDTVWEEILKTLPENKGEARLIELDPGVCYYAHSDIDDRWHLSLQAEHSFLVDINSQVMYKTEPDCKWYSFNTEGIHSAVNFSNKKRIQLVVRQLLKHNKIFDPVKVVIKIKVLKPDFRYVFDHSISPWLNKANKNGWITDFRQIDQTVEFTISKKELDSLKHLLPEEFELTCL